jgi:hypothetical protein
VRDSPSYRPFVPFSIPEARSCWCGWLALTLSASQAPSFVGSPSSRAATLAFRVACTNASHGTNSFSRGSRVPRAATLARGCRALIAPSGLFAHIHIHSYFYHPLRLRAPCKLITLLHTLYYYAHDVQAGARAQIDRRLRRLVVASWLHCLKSGCNAVGKQEARENMQLKTD